MTLYSDQRKIIYQGNGTTTTFTIPFYFINNADIQVSVSNGQTVTDLVLNTDYTLSGAENENGGTITTTVPVASGSEIAILRKVDYKQEMDIPENDRFPSKNMERALDRLTMQTQQLAEQVGRSVTVDIFSNTDPSELVNEIEVLYGVKDEVITAAENIGSIVTAANDINAIKDAPNQATAAAQSATVAEQAENNTLSYKNEASSAAQQAVASSESASNYAQSASESAQLAISALSLQVGDIGIAPFGIDESLNLRRYLNGQVISQSQFVSFTNKLKLAVALYPSLATTESNWQSEKNLSKLGQCGKFVIDDDAGTIRLPCVVNAQGLTDLQYLGTIKNQSLPNATYYSDCAWGANSGDASRSLVASKGGHEINNTGKGLLVAVKQDTTSLYEYSYGKLSASNSTYQDNAPVQQEAVQYPYYIQVATGVEETLPAIREYKTNVPYVLGDSKYFETNPYNASWLVSSGQYNAKTTYPDMWMQLQVELNTSLNEGATVVIDGKTYVKRGLPVVLSTDTITDYDFVINTADQTFRLPLKTKLASGSAVVGNGMTLGMTDGTSNGGFSSYFNGNIAQAGVWDGIYGSNVGTATSGNLIPGSKGITTDPTKSGIETSAQDIYLYYYVGDTVQDASLINAGAVLSDVSELKQNMANIDASNFTAEGKDRISEWSIPNYSAAYAINYPVSGSPFTCPENGVVFGKIAESTNNVDNILYVNGTPFNIAHSSGSSWRAESVTFSFSKGDVIYFSQTPISSPTGFYQLYFAPLKLKGI